MTWNIRSLRDDRAAVVGVIRALSPDLLLLQEAPRFLRARSRLAGLARECGLVVGVGDGREVAIVTTLRIDVSDAQTVGLSRSPGLHRRWVALARLTFPTGEVVAASVHLGLDADERRRHAAEIRSVVRQLDGDRVLIGGDLNEQSSGRAWQALGEGLLDADVAGTEPTFPAGPPEKRIDALFLPSDWRAQVVCLAELVDDAEVARASDHRPVVVDVVG